MSIFTFPKIFFYTCLLEQCGRHRAGPVCRHYCGPSRGHCRSPFLSGVRSPECFASHLPWKCKNNIRKEKQRLTHILGFSRYIIKTIIPLHRFNLILTRLQIPNVYHYSLRDSFTRQKRDKTRQRKCHVTDSNCVLSCFHFNLPSQANPLSVSKVGNNRNKYFPPPRWPRVIVAATLTDITLSLSLSLSSSSHADIMLSLSPSSLSSSSLSSSWISLSPDLRLLHVEPLVALAEHPLPLQLGPGAGQQDIVLSHRK